MSAQQTTGHMKAAYQEDHQAELTYAHHYKEHTEQGQPPVLDYKITVPLKATRFLNYSIIFRHGGRPSSKIAIQSAKSEAAEAAAVAQHPGYLNS